MNRSDLTAAGRIVVKVGTALLTGETHHVSPGRIRRIVSQIAGARKAGRQVILVTSGAVGIGLGRIRSSVYPRALADRQALAAMGQSRLMHMYEKAFQGYRLKIGQVILTTDDLHDRRRFVNVKNTLLRLLSFGAVPVVNENDTVSVDELQFGDNDTLSANTALTADADLLVILTDTDGLYTKNPKRYKTAERISHVAKIDRSIRDLAKGTDTRTAIGGMETKIRAAEICTASGIPMVIASGLKPGRLQDILAGDDVGTVFAPSLRGLTQKQRWIAHSRKKPGTIVVDDGCRKALLKRGISILPVGVTAAHGAFKKGDSIRVLDSRHRELGVGLSNYDSDRLNDCIGRKRQDEIIHCDNFVLNETIKDPL